jgi:predicted lipoprotein
MTSDQTLTKLKQELDNQQNDLTNNEKVADDLIRRIQSLDTLRNSLAKPETSESGGDENTNTVAPNDEQLVKSIEASIENLKSSGPAINQTIKKLLEDNNFNSELEKISKDIYDLRILIESTRQIANNIKVAVNFNDSTVVNLKSPADLHPSMSTTGSIYVKTNG